jgi:hypothetical protein
MICLLIQFRIIKYYFGEDMENNDQNEFSIVREKIESVVFGEISRAYIEKKNKIKYYRNVKTKENRLFSD